MAGVFKVLHLYDVASGVLSCIADNPWRLCWKVFVLTVHGRMFHVEHCCRVGVKFMP